MRPPKNPTVKQILLTEIRNEAAESAFDQLCELVENYLVDHDFDGLYTEDCGCHVSELFPCDNLSWSCQAGYEQPCDCPADEARCQNGHVGPKRKER